MSTIGFLIFCVIATSWDCVNSAGLTTHIETGERTVEYLQLESQGIDYRQLIKRHPGAFQAGNLFPDAFWDMYNCYDGMFVDVSEDTHWTPFQNASIVYIRDTYPRPWNQTVEQLVVFILGVVSHQVTDVNWHSHDLEQGFLKSMGAVNYHGSFDDAHHDGDFGSDVYNAYSLDLEYIGKVAKWYVPSIDLTNIYEVMYGEHRINSTVIEDCMDTLFKARLGEQVGVIELLYPHYAERTTFLGDRMNDFFLGAMDDIATWTANIFQTTVLMLDEGTDVCYLPKNPVYIDCSGDTTRYENSAAVAQTSLVDRADWLKVISDLVRDDAVVMENADASSVTIGVSPSYQEYLEDMIQGRLDAKAEALAAENFEEPTIFYVTKVTYSRLGESIVVGDLNADGFLDLIIGAPSFSVMGNNQQGRVYIVYGSDQGLPARNMTLEEEPHVDQRDGFKLNGRFGASMAVVDLNADGYSDLAVGAPSVGSPSFDYNGDVYIYFGSADGLSESPNVTISCTEKYCNLGWSLANGDPNQDGFQDLMLGTPFAPSGGAQRGFVGVLYAKDTIQDTSMTELDLDWRLNGDQDYEWLGFSVDSSDLSPTRSYVAAGSPSRRLCAQPDCSFDPNDIQSAGGVVYVESPLGVNDPYREIGNQALGQLGYAAASFHDHDQGHVYLMTAAVSQDVQNGVNASANFTGPRQVGLVSVLEGLGPGEPLYTFYGDREFCRFGHAMEMAFVNKGPKPDFIVAAPSRSESLNDQREEGRVFIFYDDNLNRGDHVSSEQADRAFGTGEEKSRFGSSLSSIPHGNNAVDLVVGAPHSNTIGRLAGRVAVYKL